MQAIVSDGLVNVFSDTDPAEPVLGTLYQNRDFSSQLGHTSAVLKKAPSSPQIIESRENRYEWVAHLLPDHTELEEDFLGIVVRNSVISSAEFLSLVEKIKAQDPLTLASLVTPRDMTVTQSSFGSNSRFNSRNSTS
mmetsp:Transcript_23602/g.31649  ORF Transcript_23602/g.31649 Transcript_23602/m.31649 type:complete len:137 (-) Transcript_23602:797-1207(-)